MSSNSGFRGFADFASPTFASSSGSTTAAATLAAARAAKQKKKPSLQQQSASNVSSASGAAGSASNGGSRSNSTLRPSPIYTGSDSRLIVLFRKIGQKRDPATKSRALEELISCVFPVENGHKGGVGGSKGEYSATTDASSDAGGGEFSRPEKIAALCHLIFLHETKLGYDNNASVRSGSYKALVAAKSHVPKAWISLFLGDDSSIASDDDQIEFDVDLLCTAASTVGMAWGASKGDPAAEVARNASSFIRELIASEKDASKSRNSANNDEQQPGKAIQMAVFQYSKTILGCKRASSLQEVINPPPVFTSSSSGAGSSTSGNAIGKGKKNKSQGGNKANSNNAEGAAAASESEREEMEERYERVILCALGGLGWMVESRSEKTATDASSSSFTYSNVEPFPESASIVRLMQSSRGSFRREAYTLVGKLCQSAPSLVLPRDSDASPLESQNALPLASLIPNLLSSERDPSNFVSLLEMILSYLGAFQGGTNGRWEGLDVSAFTKSLSKALRRACCGAPAAVWGPTILPIVASLPRVDDVVKSGNGDDHKEGKEGKQDHPLPLVVVESLWAGHTSAVGVTDTAAIVSAVTECTTYLMLRRTNDTHPVFSSQSWTKCGQLFLDSLLYFLTETPDAGFGPVAAAVEELCTTLSRDIQKLDAASSEGEINDRGIAELATWFWGEDGMQHTMSHGKNDNLKVRKLGALLNNISSQKRQPEDHKTSHLIPSFKKIFHSIVTDSAGRSNKTCSSDEGGLLLKIINFSGVDKLFPIRREGSTGEESMSASVERFCVNDLLRWILVHASSAPSAAKTDFDIFKKCLQSMPSSIRQKQIWETMLRELIKSYCDFTTLSIGLSTMAEGKCVTRGNADLVRCEVLDSFAIEASNKVMKSFRRSHELLRQHEDDEEGPFIRKGNLSIFLKTCTGISNSSSGILVSMSVIKHWISLCCEYENSGSNLEENLILEDESGSNTLLQTLLVLASPPGASVISDDDSLKLVFQSWFEGGRNWKDHSIKLFDSISNGASLKGRFISNASSALQNDIHCNPPSDHAVLELTCQAWANRASRLLGISQSISLDIVGLNNVELWDSAAQSGGSNHSEFYFLCIMYLLHSVESVKQRNDLIFNNNESQLFVHIQKSICEPESALLKSFSSRTSRNQQLLEILGGRDGLPDGLLERCCLDSVDLLSTIMNDATHEESESLRKALTTLSFLVSILFPTSPQNQNTNESKLEDDDIGPADVKEGDSLWYEKGGRRVKITVMKIHTDDFPNLYFTIKENESNSERQTVASRLKRNPKSIDTFTTSSHDDDDGAMRERVGRHMVDRLLKPYIFEMRFEDDVAIKSEVSAEVINVILSQCGLVSVGIGSVRYEIYQAVSSMQSLFCDALSIPGPSLDKCTNILRCLSLAMGYGIFSISSSRNVSILKIDPSVTFDKLLDLYDDKSWVEAQKQEQLEPFHLFVSMWLAVTVNVVKDGEMFRRISAMITELTDIILSERSIDLAINSFHLLRTISSIQAASNSCMDYSSLDNHDEKNTLVKLTQCFVQLNTSNTSEDIEQWIESFASLVHRNSGKSHKMLLPAAQSHASDLCDCLYSSSKRWCAFQLLHVFAKDVNPLHAEDDATVPKELEQQMSLWKEGMAEEEANELEDDIIITASWLPEKLMTTLHLIEKAAHFAHVEIDRETKAMGNLLAWITCLDILDIAGSVDMRNRSSISSFIQKTKSLEFVMNLALMEADLDINRSDNIFACVDLNGKNDFVLQKVATLVVFRTVESLPTLVKSWFNDDCPRYLQQKLSAFVENRVAPETLQRELVRIKDATSFGEMTVNGSCVSREVVATYQQDECQLSVMIRIPPTFPLRNVEVDCQKTLGIPENRWRRWALQIMLMLNNQDGSVLDALLLWKQNVDKEFDGVEPCPVCYSVLCIKTHAMPNLECKQCHYRFHTSCLYKWFSESGKSSCVLCQQPWSGTKVA